MGPVWQLTGNSQIRSLGSRTLFGRSGYAEKIDPLDEMIEDKGVRVLIDPKTVLFLLGAEMDCKVEKLSAQFIFNNPNQTAAFGCGESVQFQPASEASYRGQSHNDGYATWGGGVVSELVRGSASGSVSQMTRSRPWRMAA